jgi:hypothetical protein
MTYLATLRPDSPRLATWRELFGTTSIPVRSAIAEIIAIHGLGEAWCLRLDLGALSPEVFEHLVAYFVDGGEAPDLVRENLRTYGMPIPLGEDLDVTLGSVELLGMFGRAGLVPGFDRVRREREPPRESFGLFGPLGPRGQG